MFTIKEHQHRLEYAQRQLEHWKLKVIQHQIKAQLLIAQGKLADAERQLKVADNWMQNYSDCNDTIDGHRRAIDPSEEDKEHKRQIAREEASS